MLKSHTMSYSIRRTMYVICTTSCTIQHIRCTMYVIHYTPYNLRRTLYAVQCTLYVHSMSQLYGLHTAVTLLQRKQYNVMDSTPWGSASHHGINHGACLHQGPDLIIRLFCTHVYYIIVFWFVISLAMNRGNCTVVNVSYNV